jgi:DNA helicase IV
MRLPSYQALSKEQDRINDLAMDGRFLVTGPPGTGKTVMALYRASMLKKKGRKAKLLMYSRLLSQYTSSAIDELDLDGTVDTFHKWFSSFFWSQYHQVAPSLAPYQFDFGAALKTIAERPPAYGSIADLIIDEGQDIPKEFYVVARHMAANLVVFADENQRIMEANSTIHDIVTYAGLPAPHLLTRNYRNTREIAQLAAAFYTGLSTGIPELPERRGVRPVMRAFTSITQAVDSIRIFERTNSDLQIGVFTQHKKTLNRIWGLLDGKTKNPVQRYVGGQGSKAEPLRFEEPGITLVNYASAKGLEFDAVFLPELQDVSGDPTGTDVRMRMYVLLSRARELLVLSYSGRKPPPIVDLFPRELLEWQ